MGSERARSEHGTTRFGLGAWCLSASFDCRFVHISKNSHKFLSWEVHVARMRQKKYMLDYCLKTVKDGTL